MKPSTALKRVVLLHSRIECLFAPINERLFEILGEEAHLLIQGGDGLVICYGNADNASITPKDMDALLRLDRDQLLNELNRRGI